MGKRCRKEFKRDLNAFYSCWINLSLASDKSEIVRTKIPYFRILCSLYFVKSLWVLFLCQWNEEQKQPSRDVLRKRCSENMQQIYRRAPMPKSDFNKVAKQNKFIEITLRHGCSPADLLHIFGTPFPKTSSGLLLLEVAIDFGGDSAVLKINIFIAPS